MTWQSCESHVYRENVFCAIWSDTQFQPLPTPFSLPHVTCLFPCVECGEYSGVPNKRIGCKFNLYFFSHNVQNKNEFVPRWSWVRRRCVSVVEFHDGALGISKVFGQESTVVKWNYQILGLHQVTVHQKLGVILVIKWFKIEVSKKCFLQKRCA